MSQRNQNRREPERSEADLTARVRSLSDTSLLSIWKYLIEAVQKGQITWDDPMASVNAVKISDWALIVYEELTDRGMDRTADEIGSDIWNPPPTPEVLDPTALSPTMDALIGKDSN